MISELAPIVLAITVLLYFQYWDEAPSPTATDRSFVWRLLLRAILLGIFWFPVYYFVDRWPDDDQIGETQDSVSVASSDSDTSTIPRVTDEEVRSPWLSPILFASLALVMSKAVRSGRRRKISEFQVVIEIVIVVSMTWIIIMRAFV